MKKGLTKFMCAALTVSMAISCVPANFNAGVGTSVKLNVLAADAISVYACEGVQEAAYIEWAAVKDTSHYYVSYSKDGVNYTQIDDELIRQYPDRWRADLIGLSAGDYTIKITAKDSNASVLAEQTATCTVVAQDRTGFTFSPKSTAYQNGAVGAYNADGTLKSDARVIYVTDDNFDTIQLELTGKDGKAYTATGLADICKTMGAAASKGVTNTPLAVRFIGTIVANGTEHNDLASPNILETKGEKGNTVVNITFEGVGQDTIFYGLALRANGVGSVEIRNIAFYNWHDDGVQLQGNENTNIWIHNNDFFYGENHGGDQKKGDGATDVKDDSRYITYSYNHYWDNGKTSLCGMKSESGDNYITYHHNWFDHSDSRHPRIRTMFVHVYNNYYDGNSKYGVGAAKSSSAFVEGNYFRNCKHPMLSSLQGSDIMANEKTGAADFSAGGTFSKEAGGIIKAYNNYIVGSDSNELDGGVEPVYYNADDTRTNGAATQFDAYLASSRDEEVPATVQALSGGKTFNNANVDDYVLSIPVQEPADAKDSVTKYAGRIGNHFTFAFTADDDASYDINTELENKLKTYATDTSDDYVSIGGVADGSGPVTTISTTTESTTSETPTETTTKDSSETTTKEPVTETTTISGELLKLGEAETKFESDTADDSGSGVSVVYTESNDTWKLTDNSKTASAVLSIPFEEQTSGKVTFTGSVTPSVSAGKWSFAQLRGRTEDSTSSTEIIAIASDSSKNLAIRTNNVSYTSFGEALQADKTYSFVIVLDIDNGSADVTINGVTKTITGIDVSSVSSIYSTTAKTSTRNVSLANLKLYSSNAVSTDDFVWGDADTDKNLTANDAASILSYVLNPENAGIADSVVKYLNVDGDDTITANDAALVLQKVLNSDVKFPVEQ